MGHKFAEIPSARATRCLRAPGVGSERRAQPGRERLAEQRDRGRLEAATRPDEVDRGPAGFVSYGGAAGVRAVEQLRLVMGELLVADARAQVALSLASDFEDYTVFKPAPRHQASVSSMLDQVPDAIADAVRDVSRRAEGTTAVAG